MFSQTFRVSFLKRSSKFVPEYIYIRAHNELIALSEKIICLLGKICEGVLKWTLSTMTINAIHIDFLNLFLTVNCPSTRCMTTFLMKSYVSSLISHQFIAEFIPVLGLMKRLLCAGLHIRCFCILRNYVKNLYLQTNLKNSTSKDSILQYLIEDMERAINCAGSKHTTC